LDICMEITTEKRYYLLRDTTGFNDEFLEFIGNTLILPYVYGEPKPIHIRMVLNDDELKKLVKGLNQCDFYFKNRRASEIKPFFIGDLKLVYDNRGEPYRQGVSLFLKQDKLLFIEESHISGICRVYSLD